METEKSTDHKPLKESGQTSSGEDRGNGEVKLLPIRENENLNHSEAPFSGFGIVCALLCGTFFAMNTLFAKMVTSVHPIQHGVARCYVQFMILLPFLQYKHKSINITGPRGKTLYLCLVGILASSSMILVYLSLGELSLGNAVTISFLNTVITPIIARIFLKESLTILDCVFAIVSLCGVVLIAQPPILFPDPGDEKRQSPIGVLYAVLSAFLTSFSYIAIRKLGKETHFALSVFYYSVIGSITTTILLLSLNEFRFPCSSDLFYLFSLGVLGVLAQALLTIALQWERASTVGMLRNVQIILVYIMQVSILKDIPSTISLFGALLIFSSSLGIGIRKIFNEKKRFSLRKE